MQEIKQLLRSLSASGKYKGFNYLAYGIKIISQNEDELHLLSKSLYPQIAKKYNTTPLCVERDIRTVVVNIWKRCNREYLNKVASCDLTEQPTSSEMLDFLADYIRRMK